MDVLMRVAQRLLQIVPTVALVAVLMFVLMRLLPGDPAIQLLGDRATDANIARLRHELGFDRSVAVQFWTYLVHVATLRLGDFITLHAPVTQLIAERIPITLMLTAMAAVLALLIAVPLAFIAALIAREASSTSPIRMVGQVGLSMPVFYLGLILLITLAAGLGWFPVGGIGGGFVENLYYLILPALTLALSLAMVLMRNLRDAADRGAARGVRAIRHLEGIAPPVVLGRHVLRNAMVSTVTLMGLQIGSLARRRRDHRERVRGFPVSAA